MHACPCGHGQPISPAALIGADSTELGPRGGDYGWSPWASEVSPSIPETLLKPSGITGQTLQGHRRPRHPVAPLPQRAGHCPMTVGCGSEGQSHRYPQGLSPHPVPCGAALLLGRSRKLCRLLVLVCH